jgi:hypothetical protein
MALGCKYGKFAVVVDAFVVGNGCKRFHVEISG